MWIKKAKAERTGSVSARTQNNVLRLVDMTITISVNASVKRTH